jgi:hypothetical protein
VQQSLLRQKVEMEAMEMIGMILMETAVAMIIFMVEGEVPETEQIIQRLQLRAEEIMLLVQMEA